MDRRLPGSVALAIRAAWGLVGVIAVTVVLLAVFRNDVVGSWARRHEGAREAFAEGGREGLAQANLHPPAFLPVGATMLVVFAMLVWVLTAFFREGHRWGQLGLTGLVAVCAFASIDFGFLLRPPAVFVVIAAVSLVVEGVVLVALWHRDTLRYLAGPWADDPVPGAVPEGADRPVDAPLEGPVDGPVDGSVDTTA